jgi:CRP-like cAMP-binding protein
MKITTIGQGQTLFKEGAKCDSIYFIKSGQVEVSRLDQESGKKVVLQVLGPESVVGTMSFLLGLERSATAVCLSEVKCIEIKEAQRDTLRKQIPPWLQSLLKDLVGIIKGQNEKYLEAQRLINGLENKLKKLNYKLDSSEATEDKEEVSKDKEEASKDKEEASKEVVQEKVPQADKKAA